MKTLLFLILLGSSAVSLAQVAITTNASQPDPSAMLDVKSATRGVLFPRVTLVQRNAIASPATGLLIYQTDNTPGYYYNSGPSEAPHWIRLGQLTLPYEDSANASPYTHVFKISTHWAHFAPAIYGLTTSQEGVAIVGENSSGQSSGNAIEGKTNTETGIAITGQQTNSTGSGEGVRGTSFGTTGVGVKGWAESATGQNVGVEGGTSSPEGIGVYGTAKMYGIKGSTYWASSRAVTGEATGTESIGVKGIAMNTNSTGVWGEGYNQGVYGTSDGRGVYGFSSSPTGIGVYGESEKMGMYANATSTTSDVAYGIYGSTQSANGAGVYAFAASLTGSAYGLRAVSSAPLGYGAYGKSAKYGVFGLSTGTQGRAVTGEATGTSSIGVYGKAAADNSTAVYADGLLYDFYAAGPGTNYGAASSVRWKTNITALSDPLGKIGQLRGVYFNWDAAHGGQHDVGMIAEEVGRVMPEIVVYESNGKDASGMDYSKLAPLLLEGIKALKAENDMLRARLEKLEQMLNAKVRQ